MKRRTLLKTSALATLALAGCVGGGDGSGPGDEPSRTPTDESTETPAAEPTGTPTDEPTETPTDDPTKTPPPVSVREASVETLSAECGSGDSGAAISFEESGPAVSFSGTLTASTPCHEATLEGVAYDEQRDALVAVLGTESTDEMCTDCVGSVQFSGEVALDGGLPARVFVEYDETVLASATPGGTDDGPAPSPLGSSFAVVEIGAGSPDGDEVDIEFDTETNEVVLTGTIPGSNGCATAKLGDANYDAETDTLTVDVVTAAREGTEDKGCTQAFVGIQYSATFSFEGGLPKTVSVSHDGDGVAAAAHGSSSASGSGD
jgi:hypothetical protein